MMKEQLFEFVYTSLNVYTSPSLQWSRM